MKRRRPDVPTGTRMNWYDNDGNWNDKVCLLWAKDDDLMPVADTTEYLSFFFVDLFYLLFVA